MNVNISEKTESKLKEIAEQQGQNVADYAGVLLEEFIEEKANGNNPTAQKKERKHNLLKFAGKYSSGKTDTSERMHEILYTEKIDPSEGFNIK